MSCATFGGGTLNGSAMKSCGCLQRLSLNIRRRSSIAMAWRKISTLEFVAVYGKVCSVGKGIRRSQRGTIKEATVSQTQMNLMVIRRASVMRLKFQASWKLLSAPDCL